MYLCVCIHIYEYMYEYMHTYIFTVYKLYIVMNITVMTQCCV